jgi:hypothetical protein
MLSCSVVSGYECAQPPPQGLQPVQPGRNSSSGSDDSGDDESEERVLGSDEDEQEDPRDYDKGAFHFSYPGMSHIVSLTFISFSPAVFILSK